MLISRLSKHNLVGVTRAAFSSAANVPQNMGYHRSPSITQLPLSGQIQLILGPMFSGKTTELLRRIQRYSIAQLNCLLVKYSGDNRYDGENIMTHDKRGAVDRDNVHKITTSSLKVLLETESISEYECIGIDEGQFFPDLLEFCEKAANMGIVVVVAALSGDFERKPFGQILNLIPLCEDVCSLRAVCMSCFREEAAFSFRLTEHKQVEMIGGTESYKALCRSCYISHNAKRNQQGS